MRARRLPTSTRHGCHEGSGRCVRIPVIAHLSITTGAYPHSSNVAMKCVVRPGARPRRADFVPFGSEGMRLERSVAAGHGGRTVSIAAAAIRFMPEQQRHTMHPDYTVLRGQDQRADCVLKLRDTAAFMESNAPAQRRRAASPATTGVRPRIPTQRGSARNQWRRLAGSQRLLPARSARAGEASPRTRIRRTW